MAVKATTNGRTKNRIKDIVPVKEAKIKPIDVLQIKMRIVGISPYIAHNWSEKSLGMMRDKHAGKKTKNRDVRDPEAEGKAARYLTDDGKDGIPLLAVKSAVLSAAHKDLGIPRTLVSKAAFLKSNDRNKVLPLILEEEPVIQEDSVRVGNGSTDLRYRPYYFEWAVDLHWEVDIELLQLDDLLSLIDRAGFGVGVGEWRPERGGEFGRFRVDTSTKITGS